MPVRVTPIRVGGAFDVDPSALLGIVLSAGMAGERVARPQVRTRQAALRAMQLRAWIQRLRSGAPATIEDVRGAGDAAAQAAVNAAHARRVAADA
jgi:hypothetical protein